MSWSFSAWTMRWAQFSVAGTFAFTVFSRCKKDCTCRKQVRLSPEPSRESTYQRHGGMSKARGDVASLNSEARPAAEGPYLSGRFAFRRPAAPSMKASEPRPPFRWIRRKATRPLSLETRGVMFRPQAGLQCAPRMSGYIPLQTLRESLHDTEAHVTKTGPELT